MPNQLAAAERETREQGPDRVPEAVFIIDDDPLMAKVLERHLARRGFGAVCFDDPHLLLEALAASVPALLFSDLEMPRMRGGTLIARAREMGYKGTIVLVTASRERSALAEAIGSGADEILAKPIKDFDLDIILEKTRVQKRRALPTLEMLRAVIEPVDQGVILVDEEGVPFDANRRAREMLEAGSVADIASAIERSGFSGEMVKNLNARGDIAFVDVSGPEGKGKRLPVGLEVHKVECAASGIVRVVLLHDFSQWRRLDELHSRFATYLSHRIRTPLTSARNAVAILSGNARTLDVAEKERFLEIGCRNIEKLISSFDELQKIFMVESGEIASCRSIVRISKELQSILGECEKEGKIEGFKLRSPECAVFTGRARFREYVLSAIEAIVRWCGKAPYIECVATLSDASSEALVGEPMLFLSLAPRVCAGESGMGLGEFLRLREAQKELVLEKLAHALDGAHEATARNALRLGIPVKPAFDREKDLVHPLHVMLEKAELEGVEFHLISVRMMGAASGAQRCVRFLEANLCTAFPQDEAMVSQGEEPFSFALFVAGAARSRIDKAMERVRNRFVRSCKESAEEICSSIRWEIAYSRERGSARDGEPCSLLNSVVSQNISAESQRVSPAGPASCPVTVKS